MTPYRFERRGRRWQTGATVAAVLAGLAAIWVFFDAALWVIAIFALSVVPALWDLWAAPRSGLALDDDSLTWWSGRAKASVDRDEIDVIRIDTKWDFSLRISAMLTTGRRVRLPYECTPPEAPFTAALEDAGLRIERHHFTLR